MIPIRFTARARRALALAVCALGASTALAQSNPRDLSGTWRDGDGNVPFILSKQPLPLTPEAKTLSDDRNAAFRGGRGYANAHLTCRPTGVQGFTAPKGPLLITENKNEIVMISQEDREVRRIFLNETAHPAGLHPTYSGHSIGHWEGNTLVVDTVGFNDYGQLDEAGAPHSADMHMVERITKSADGKHLTNEISVTEPKYYTKPFTVTRVWDQNQGVKLLDYDCAENPREDTFEVMTFNRDWFKPVCVRHVRDGGIADDKVTCTPGKAAYPPEKK